MNPIKKNRIVLGMKVSCKITALAYGTGWNAVPAVYFQPGMIGTVGAIDVPCVTTAHRRMGDTDSFVCVDFESDGKKYRCALYYNNIVIPKE